jgi:hypothetical protein
MTHSPADVDPVDEQHPIMASSSIGTQHPTVAIGPACTQQSTKIVRPVGTPPSGCLRARLTTTRLGSGRVATARASTVDGGGTSSDAGGSVKSSSTKIGCHGDGVADHSMVAEAAHSEQLLSKPAVASAELKLMASFSAPARAMPVIAPTPLLTRTMTTMVASPAPPLLAVVMPHPSGVSHFWNSPNNIANASDVFRAAIRTCQSQA